MKKSSVYISLVVILVAMVQFVDAGGVGATVKVGTLGVGADLTVGVSEAANLRFGVNALSLDMDVDSDDEESSSSTAEEVNLELSLLTVAALVDWHPFKGHLRLTCGLMLNNNEVDLTASGSSVELNGTDYTVTSLSGNVAFDSIAPYAGIGGGNAVGEDGRWSFAWDLGVMIQGDPDVTLTATATNPALQAQLDAAIAEEIKDIEDDTDVMSLYPVLMIGVGYRF
jgi:hypothetical protein